jgi:Thymidylate synthase
MIIIPKNIAFEGAFKMLTNALLDAPRVDVGSWHAKDVKGRPDLVSKECANTIVEVACPDSIEKLQEAIRPHLPWAEDHFQERVSRVPSNPPKSAEQWSKGVDKTVVDQHRTVNDGGVMKYTHTYPERFWPLSAGRFAEDRSAFGIRYRYGDLDDVVELMKKSPLTRQAFLPIWFPEDTGAVHGGRVPCTLGYGFLTREGKTQISYFIRSVDFVRHFRDDVYLALRLLQWMCTEIGTTPGHLIMHITSLHIFEGDVPILRRGNV